VYEQAILRIEGGAVAGDEVSVVDPRGNFMGRGFYSPGSAIPVRILVRDRDTPIDAELFRSRIERAVHRRRSFGLPSPETNAVRMVNAEGDDLPGLVLDVFGDVAVVQLGTIGMKRRETLVLEGVERVLAPRAIIDRTSAGWRAEKTSSSARASFAATPPFRRCRFANVDWSTNFHCRSRRRPDFTSIGADARTCRAAGPRKARSRRLQLRRRVCDGGRARGRDGIVAVDESALALEVGAECARRNGFIDRIRYVRSDARERMTLAGREGGFDLVLCDPPKFAPSKSSKFGASGPTKSFVRLRVAPRDPVVFYLIASCSAAIGLDLLTRALAIGARDVNVRATVLERFFQGFDHPVPAPFPEGLYLKSLLACVEPA
jgi:23S rRNA (cytosine1962-C5)-methyltransferase